MKGSELFKQSIKEYLDKRAAEDEQFAKVYAKEKKNLDDCVTYILNTVKKSGNNGFADEEIYGMAVHYYDEDDIKIGGKISGTVVVNHTVKKGDDDTVTNHEKPKVCGARRGKQPVVAGSSLFDTLFEEEEESDE
jgi:hypothetical protein